MTLVLTIKALDRLDNGEAARLKLDRHGARIGRSPHMDWCLPDPRSYISSAHCEIEYRDDGYLLVDRSTNGTFVNRSTARITSPHRIADGDVILVGHYEIEARLDRGREADNPAAAPAAWGGWDSHGAREPVGDPARWDQPPARAATSGQGSVSGAWAPPRMEPTPQPSSAWAAAQPQAPPPSAWSSEPAVQATPAAVDVWGQLAVTNEVDWARGFAAPATSAFSPPPTSTPTTAPWGEVAMAPPPETTSCTPTATKVPLPKATSW